MRHTKTFDLLHIKTGYYLENEPWKRVTKFSQEMDSNLRGTGSYDDGSLHTQRVRHKNGYDHSLIPPSSNQHLPTFRTNSENGLDDKVNSGIEKDTQSTETVHVRFPTSQQLRPRQSIDCLKETFSFINCEKLEKGDIPKLPELYTKLHKMRHVVGFRCYNKLIKLSAESLQVCYNIVLLLKRPLAIESVLEKINDSIEGLREAEFRFYKECDRIVLFEQKSCELDFLKKNIQSCIRNSIGIMKRRFLESESICAYKFEKIKDILSLPWSDHNMYYAVVTELGQHLIDTERCIIELESGTLNAKGVMAYVDSVILFVQDCYECNSIQRVLEAGANLEVLQYHYFKQLRVIEDKLNKANQKNLVAASVLISLTLETEKTKRLLVSRATGIAKTHANARVSTVFEEERTLLEFIYNGREYEREEKKRIAEEQEVTNDSHGLAHDALPPMPSNSHDQSQENCPVWAQSWTTSPVKILGKKKKDV